MRKFALLTLVVLTVAAAFSQTAFAQTQIPSTSGPPLPEGAIFASASVAPGTTIQVEQAGYALIATAEVLTAKRVKPGDRLDANTTSSIQFDDGTGVVVDVLKKTAVGAWPAPRKVSQPSFPFQLGV